MKSRSQEEVISPLTYKVIGLSLMHRVPRCLTAFPLVQRARGLVGGVRSERSPIPFRPQVMVRAIIGHKLNLSGSCQGDLRRGWKKNRSEPRCCSGKGATINLTLGFRCCLTIPKSWFSLAAKYLTVSVA